MKFLKYFLLTILIHGCNCPGIFAQSLSVSPYDVQGINSPLNFVKNPYAKDNGMYVTTSNATQVRDGTTDKLFGWSSQSCTTTALNGYCEFDLKPIVDPFKTGNCEFSGVFKGDASLHRFQILDASGVVKNQSNLGTVSTSDFTRFLVAYPCQVTPKVRFTQTVAGAATAVKLGVYYGPAMSIGSSFVTTPWQSYTPVVTNFGTGNVPNMQWRQNGPNLELKGRIDCGTSVPAALGSISLPNGLMPSAGPGYGVAGVFFRSQSAADHGGSVLYLVGNNTLTFSSSTVFGSIASNPTAPANTNAYCGNGDVLLFNLLTIPIAGWENNVSVVTAANWNYDWRPANLSTTSLQGFGTVSYANQMDCRYKRQGGDLQYKCKFTTGTIPAGTQGRWSLPAGLTVSSIRVPSITRVGSWNRNVSGANSPKGGTVLAVGGQNYLTFSVDDFVVAIDPLSPSNSDQMVGSTQVFDFSATVPVSENGVDWGETYGVPQLVQSVIADTNIKAEKSVGVSSIDYGTYSATVAGGANATSVTSPITCNYTRVANVVSGSCRISLGCTVAAGTGTNLLISLPVATTQRTTIVGGFNSVVAQETGYVIDNGSSNTSAQVTFLCYNTGSATRTINFQYLVQ